MMIGTSKHILRFILFVLLQGLILGQIEFGFGIHPMIYPMFILLLPFETPAALLLLIGFVTGVSIDFFMNTFGLHASCALVVAYMRPMLYAVFSPREGYDNIKSPTLFDYGGMWFISTAGITVFTHHFLFFTLEVFKLSEFLMILQKTIFSSILTILFIFLGQIVFFKKDKVI